MIKTLLRKKKPASPAPRVPADRRVYAIGDIHGCDDLFERLLDKIDTDHRTRPPKDLTLILLGDLVDRGPDSARVVERAMRLAESGRDVRFLTGNHEEVFLLALDGKREALKMFTRIGGRETILSYGISEQTFKSTDYEELLVLLREAVPATHIAFMRKMENVIPIGDYVFVHAGIRPGIPLAAQQPADLRWIRNEFLSHAGIYEKFVIHGHTITDEVDHRPNRLGIDTGAYANGRLTAVMLEDDQRFFLST